MVSPPTLPNPADVPDGFEPLPGSGTGFDTLSGPYFGRVIDGVPVIGVRIEARHLNSYGSCHGGVLLTMADYQGASVRYLAGIGDHDTPSVTVSLDFVARVHAGAWLEMHCRLVRRTKHLLFSEGNLVADGEIVGRIDGIYKIRGVAPGRPPGNSLTTL